MPEFRGLSVIPRSREILGVVSHIDSLPVRVVESPGLRGLEGAYVLVGWVADPDFQGVGSRPRHHILFLNMKSGKGRETESCGSGVFDGGDEVLPAGVNRVFGLVGPWSWIMSLGCQKH